MATRLEKTTVFLSVAAIAISVLSLLVAYETYDIERRGYDREATPLLQFTVDNEKKSIKIHTSTDNVHIDEVLVYYASDLSTYYKGDQKFASLDPFSGWVPVQAPTYEWQLFLLNSALEKMCSSGSEACVSKVVLSSSERYPEAGTPLSTGVPVCLDIKYTYRTESKRATAVYLLPFGSTQREITAPLPLIFNTPRLVRYLDTSENMQEVLNNMLTDDKPFVKPLRQYQNGS